MTEQQPSAPTPKEPTSELVRQFRFRAAKNPGALGERFRCLVAEDQASEATEHRVPSQVITLYVRRDDSYREPARTIALRPIPQGPGNNIGEGASAEDALLWTGFAIDGDSAILTVTPLTRVTWPPVTDSRPRPRIEQAAKGEIEPQSLSTALQKVQAALHLWLRSCGYDVKFA